MSDFYQFVEAWCRRYKPMQHVSGEDSRNRRFFLTTGFMAMADWMRNADPEKSPVIIMESNVEGELGDYDTMTHVVHCVVRATDQQNGYATKNAVQEGKRHLQKLWVYIMGRKKAHDERLKGVKIESSLHYKSTGPIYDGWMDVSIEIDEVKMVNMCIDENDYIQEGSGSGSGE